MLSHIMRSLSKIETRRDSSENSSKTWIFVEFLYEIHPHPQDSWKWFFLLSVLYSHMHTLFTDIFQNKNEKNSNE